MSVLKDKAEILQAAQIFRMRNYFNM